MKKYWMLAIAVIGTFVAHYAFTQSTSNYTFRFNTGVSSVFLNNMTFASQQQLNLGACTVTEKINGPLSCAVNCNNDSVCVLDLSGPSGSTVNDVMELVSETPVSSASPTPTSSPGSAYLGSMIRSSKSRVDAYNSVKTGTSAWN